MPCRRFESRMQELLDDRLDPTSDAALLEHTEACAECRVLLDAQRIFFDSLTDLAPPSLPSDFSRRVVATVVLQKRSRARFVPAAVLAIAAALLLTFVLGPQLNRGRRSAAEAQAVAAADARSTLVGKGAAGYSIVDFDSHDLQIAIELFVAQLSRVDGAHFQVDQLAGTIRPLASTLNVAFDAIRRTIPGHRPATQPPPQAREMREHWARHVG